MSFFGYPNEQPAEVGQAEGRAAAAIVLGNDPEVVAAVTAAVENRAEISPAQVAGVRRGDWGC